ncbi:MAG: cysteine desulfurase [Candidatus Eisenbacteria bacterium]|uniref:Cysteine desulfurase n=1 Tax=Eiseniibacteriota bacterium TaxID=2212470 RepID=A0A948RZA2_UNCEI|nr:cysteine desulfurase [Candidatus Eisenbacteria bacterium]MBU1949825.1 cysteine desulfurase [Candidatus Eisenbacteria bacterium]MBU2692716.1 cysteine desulfurase [Candidatus Eisenbacteria bacterium]
MGGSLDIAQIRKEFPIFDRSFHGHRLVYLDNSATSQKPMCVLDALTGFYKTSNANVHRGISTLSREATEAYEETRRRVAGFLGNVPSKSIVFTRGTTESINLIAWAWARRRLKAGDEILLTEMEHHSNLIPWMLIARESNLVLRHIPVTDDGRLQLEALDDLLTEKTKIVSVTRQSNVTGTMNPVAEIARRAKAFGAKVLIDGAQSVPHESTRIEDFQCDALAFSAHKMLGPTGVGVLYADPAFLEEMEPYQGGGEMIQEVTRDHATWRAIPWKFEAGTPNIAGVVAFKTALDFLEAAGLEKIAAHENRLRRYALDRLLAIEGLRILGGDTHEDRGGVLSFVLENLHPHDLATVLNERGIVIRAGHHCAQPLMRRFNVAAAARISFYIYNDTDDVDALAEGIDEAVRYFAP